jgi:Rrf2 family protein
MRVSQRLDYALRALVYLAGRRRRGYTSGAEIATHLGLPQRVVEQQLSQLSRAGILRSRRGAGGGHQLARQASEISVADVVRAIDGDVLDAPRTAGSATADFWARSADSLGVYLQGTTVAMLAEEQARIDSTAALTYYI